MNDWRDEPATKRQKDNLVFFGCTFAKGITKGQASDAITKCIEMFPEKEKAYHERPATEEQQSEIKKLLKTLGASVADYLDESEPANIASLTYAEAKDLIEELEIDASQKAWEELDSEYIIDIGDWSELYPGLTDKRVQKAAKVLDEARPGWRNENNHIDLVIGKVGEQNPQLLERWQRKAEGKPRGSGRWSKNSGSGCSAVIFLAVVVWFIWKLASK